MADSQDTSPAAQQPTSDELLTALERAHLAGDTNAAREFAQWHQELYAEQPEPEGPGLVERGMNALGSLVTSPEDRDHDNLKEVPGDAARKIADAGRRGAPPEPQQPEVDAYTGADDAQRPRPTVQPPDALGMDDPQAFQRQLIEQRQQQEQEAPAVDAMTGADRKPEDIPDYNMARAAAERTADLGAGALTTINTLAASAEEAMPLGGFVWEDGKALPSYKTPQQYAEYKAGGGEESLVVAADRLKDVDAGYVPEHTWEALKDEFGENGPLSGSAWAEVARYGAEQGIQSIPDMVAVSLSLPAYVLGRSGEIAETRAQNKGKDEPELAEVLEATPVALGSAILERIGAKGITGANSEKLGTEALKRGIGYAGARIAREGAEAGGKEAATELVQEGVIEYIGERFGTDAEMSFREGAEMGLAGAVAGGVYGTAAGTATAGAREAARPGAEAEVAAAMRDEAQDYQPPGESQQETAQRFLPENAQQDMEPQSAPAPESPAGPAPRKSMADLVREKLADQGLTQTGAQNYLDRPTIQPPYDVDLGLPSRGKSDPDDGDSQGAQEEGEQAAPAAEQEADATEAPATEADATRQLLGNVEDGQKVRLRNVDTAQDGMEMTIDRINEDGSAEVTLGDGSKRRLSMPAMLRAVEKTEDGVLADAVEAQQPARQAETPKRQQQGESLPANRKPEQRKAPEPTQGREVSATKEYRDLRGRVDNALGEGSSEASARKLDAVRRAIERSSTLTAEQRQDLEQRMGGEQDQQGPQRGEIGGRIAQGETRETASGRETTPFPRTDTSTPRKAKNTERRIDKWLIDNATEEARARGDRPNLRDFENMDLGNLSPADKDLAELYLFGDEQPDVLPPTLKPLSEDGARADESGQLDQSGEGALERAPAQEGEGAQAPGDARPDAESGRRADATGSERAGGRRAPAGRGVSDGAGEVPVSAGRDSGAGQRQPGRADDAGRDAGTEPRDGDQRQPEGGQQGQRQPGERERGDRGSADNVERREEAAEDAPTPKGETTERATPASERPAGMFTITGELGTGGPKTKFKNNLAAIKTLKTLAQEGRDATPDEQVTLSRYVGWGGLPQAFEGDGGKVTKGWEKEARQLKEALTDAEYQAARRSTQDAHYTATDIVGSVWDALEHMGFTGGRVLEPSVGTGNFLGLMPTGPRSKSQITAVELDHITGGIARALYPAANVQAPVGFQDFTMPDGYFDVAVGNPPFGSQRLYDGKRKHLSKFSIHNYFFAKSLDGLKPDGVLAMVVSSRLMDAGNTRAREYIAGQAELLGAIRLPNNAFLKNAGTEVTTDLVFLRKLKEGEQPTGESWGKVSDVTDANGVKVPLNEYFHRNPEMMLGEWGAYGSMYGPDEPALVAREGQDTNALLKEAVRKLPEDVMQPAKAEPTSPDTPRPVDVGSVKVGSMFMDGDTIMIRREDELGQHRADEAEIPSAKGKKRVEGMIGVRDVAADLRKAQLSDNVTESALDALRDKLNNSYDAFVKANGPINLDANKRLMRDDPTWPQLAALEEGFDKGVSKAVAKRTGEEQRKPSAKKAAIFSRRTQQPYQPPSKAASAQDAMAASLSEFGTVDMDYMAKLYGRTPEAIADELGELVYEATPGNWEPRDAYLSGNVKHKLALAEQMAKDMPRFKRNVEALREVLPEDIEAVDISVKPGAHWLPKEDMTAFAQEIMGSDTGRAVYIPPMAKWEIRGNPAEAARSKWATERVSVPDILAAAANQKQIVVRDKMPDETTRINESATNAANEKVERVKAEFKRWIWQDDARRERLSRLYNDTFNTDRIRQYDGSHLTFPGKVGDDIIKLRPHQANAVWRIVQKQNTLLDHTVGTGKTFTMVAGAMEMRRMGRARKPMVVVPNHLVGQWAEDFTKLYPGANILAATKKDFEKGNRQQLFARIATGDWDAVIVAHSSIGKVEMDASFQEKFINQQIRDMDEAIAGIRQQEGKNSRSVKQVEKQKERLEEKLKRLFDSEGKDDNLTFGELGVDALFLDEAHEFKNLGFATSMTRVAGLGNPQGSQKAADMFMKVRYINEVTGGNVVFATGTPISNTMAEMYTMQRYLDYNALQDQGIAHFDAWARMYGEVVTDWELSPSGTYKLNSRFAKFVNIPEMMQRYLSFGDVITREDMARQMATQGTRLPVPKVKGGKPENIVVERSDDQAEYIGEPTTDANGNEVYPPGTLVHRAENLPKKPEKGADNMLKIMSDARKAALDMRLIDPSYPDNPESKVSIAADRITDLHKQWADDRAGQLVFIDLSTPKGAKAAEAQRLRDLVQRAEDGDERASEQLDKMSPDELSALDGDFSVYDDLRAKLIERGIPESEIAFIHSANTELQKEEMFSKVRTGRIRVLLGSTAKMGAGMNVQERLVALHHLDAPWRPSDLEQREGRIIRQGNKLWERDPDGFEVEVVRYATKQTLDSRMWQTIETKARFIEQVRKGNTKTREVEDVAGEASNAAEMKAASSGNPLILEEMDLRQKMRKLESLQEEHDREQFRIRDRIRQLKREKERVTERVKRQADDVKRAEGIPGKGFTIKVSGETFKDSYKEAGQAVLGAAAKMADKGEESRRIGDYHGFDLRLDNVSGVQFVLTLEGNSEHQMEINNIGEANPTGLARRIKNTAAGIPDKARQDHQSLKRIDEAVPELEKQIDDWPQLDELARIKTRHNEVIQELQPKGDGQQAEGEPQGQGEGDQPDTLGMASPGGDTPMPNWVPTYRQKGILPRRPESGEFMLDGRKVKLKPEDKPTRREGIRVMVIDAIGPRLYQGKIKGKSRLGFYRQPNSEVRISNFDDVEVMAHEMAHYLDMHYTHKARFNRAYNDTDYRSEVEALSYTSRDNLKGPEGFAEFVRLWLTQFDEAQAQAPEFTGKFEEVLAQDKALDRKMRRMREEMHRWYRQGDLAQAYAVTSGNQYTNAQEATLMLNRRPGMMWRQRYIDKIHAAKVMERELTGGMADATESAYKQLQLLNGIEGISQESFKRGALTIGPDGNIGFTGPSLKDVWDKSLRGGTKAVREQELYFAARRAQELKRQGRENLITEGMIREGLAMAKKRPELAKAFDDYQAYRKNMMEFYVDSGYVTRDAADAMMERNRDYVPFHRAVESVNDAYTGGGGFQRLKGGTQNIKPIYDNMMMQEQRHIYAALKSRAMRELYSEALENQDGSLFLAKIAPDSKPVKVALDQMTTKTADAMADAGISIATGGEIVGDGETVVDSADIQDYFEKNPEELMFWTFGHKPRTLETMVDSFIDHRGKRVWVEIQKENRLLADMIDNMDYVALPQGSLGTAVKLAMRVKNFQTMTITSMAQFLGPNMVRDAQQAFTLSGGKFKPGWDTMRGMLGQLHALTTDKSAWHEMAAQGGPTAGRVRTFYHENWGLSSEAGYRSRKPVYHPSQMMRSLLDVYMSVADSAEIATRLGFYMRQRKEGVSPREAAWQAREISTDFRKHGSYASWVLLQRTVPFLGAYVQSVDRDIRSLAENKGKMTLGNLVKTESGRAQLSDIKSRVWMAGALIVSVTALLALLNEDEDRYQGLTPDQKARFYHLFIGGKHYTIPKPHGFISLMAQGAESMMDAMTTQSGKDAADTMKFAAAYHFGADAMPGIFNPVAEAALNRKFTGAPIVSRYAQDREPRYQYDDRTPLIYVNVGRALNISPDRAHHMMRGYTGYVSDFIDEFSEKMLWDSQEWGERPFTRNFGDMAAKQFVPREVPYRTKWTTGYYELRRRAAAAQANLSFLTKSEALRDQGPALKFSEDRVNGALLGINRAFSRIDAAFSDQDKVIAGIKYNPALTAEQKEARIEDYYSQKNDALGKFYRQVSERLEEVESSIE